MFQFRVSCGVNRFLSPPQRRSLLLIWAFYTSLEQSHLSVSDNLMDTIGLCDGWECLVMKGQVCDEASEF